MLRSTTLLFALLLGLAPALTACLEELPKASLIDDIRILAVRAEPPEVSPGDEVVLDALIVDPMNRPRTLTWYTCLQPERGQGGFEGGSDTGTSGGSGASLIDPGSCVNRTEEGDTYAQALGSADSVTMTIPADLFDTQQALRLAYGLSEDIVLPDDIATAFLSIAGVNLTVTLIVTLEDGTKIETQKRVNVSVPSSLVDNNAPNLNPTESAYHLANKSDDADPPTTGERPADGSCFIPGVPAVQAGETYIVAPVNVPDPQAAYVVLLAGSTDPDVPFEIQDNTETYFYAFFATAGDIGEQDTKSTNGPATAWKLDAEDAGAVDFWIVNRDGRGGTDWCRSTLVITP